MDHPIKAQLSLALHFIAKLSSVMPAKAGIHQRNDAAIMDSRLRGNDNKY